MNAKKYAMHAKDDFRRFPSLDAYIAHLAVERGITKSAARKLAQELIPLEKKYQKAILDALRQEFPEGRLGRFRKVAQGFASRNGEPDVDGVLNGGFIAIEVKRPLLGEATPLQKKAVREIRQAGGCAMIASYPDEVIAAVHAWLRGEPYWYELTGCAEAVAEGEEENLA